MIFRKIFNFRKDVVAGKYGIVIVALCLGLFTSAVSAETVYSVREGDTLESIAKDHHTTPVKITELNPHLASKGFAPGLVLLLPDNLAAEISRQQSRVTDPIVVAGVLHDPPKASEVPVTDRQLAKFEDLKRRQSLSSRRGMMVRDLTHTAKSYLGVPYQMGGTSRRAIDCSGFTMQVFASHSIKLPRTADVQYNVGKKVPRGQEQPGDLVFFETYLPGPSHVGIFIGGGQFIHASSSRGVTITPLKSTYFGPRYLGAKRVF